MRAALYNVLDMLAREETRRAALASQGRCLHAEREWRAALVEIVRSADAELVSAGRAIEARCATLAQETEEQLAAIAPTAAVVNDQLGRLKSIADEFSSQLSDASVELRERVQTQLLEQTEQIRALSSAVDASTMSAANERRHAAEAAGRIDRVHRGEIEELVRAHEASHAILALELADADATVLSASRAVAVTTAIERVSSMELAKPCGEVHASSGGADADSSAIHVAGGVGDISSSPGNGDGRGACDAWSPVRSSIAPASLEVVAHLGHAVETMVGRANEAAMRCDEVSMAVRREEDRARGDEARAERVDASLRQLEARVAALAPFRAQCDELRHELGEVMAERDKAVTTNRELEQTIQKLSASAAEQKAMLEASGTRRDATERGLRAALEQEQAALRAMEAQVVRAESHSTDSTTRLEAQLAAATARATQAEARADLADSVVAELSAYKERCGALAQALQASQTTTKELTRELETAHEAALDAARDAEAARAAAVAEATRDAAAASEALLHRERARRTTAEEAVAAAETAAADAEYRVFYAAHRLRALQTWRPSPGAADAIDAALANALHGCALPRKVQVERITRGHYWVRAVGGGGGLRASRAGSSAL